MAALLSSGWINYTAWAAVSAPSLINYGPLQFVRGDLCCGPALGQVVLQGGVTESSLEVSKKKKSSSWTKVLSAAFELGGFKFLKRLWRFGGFSSSSKQTKAPSRWCWGGSGFSTLVFFIMCKHRRVNTLMFIHRLRSNTSDRIGFLNLICLHIFKSCSFPVDLFLSWRQIFFINFTFTFFLLLLLLLRLAVPVFLNRLNHYWH